jgi:hypothetical protein
MTRRIVIKILHEVGAVGIMGTLAACLVLAAAAPADSPAGFAAVHAGIAMLMRWLLLPAAAACLVSGLLALTMNRAYLDAGWAWLKALLGLGVMEGCLLAAQEARRASDLAAKVVAGDAEPAVIVELQNAGSAGSWVLLTIALANVVLGVWRPRFSSGR